jgi:UDP-N-acetylmuramoyl-tripeptide--D-alanyl-D-alanine ligase
MPRLDHLFVAQATGASLLGAPPAEAFSGVSTDSRHLEDGQLFVALAGPNFDGHDYVEAALAAGASAALVGRGFQLPDSPRACLLAVDDTLTALGDLAAAWRREHSALVAAVTGSNGKTTTKEMLASIMSQRHRVLKNQGNFNNLIGLPLTLLGLTAAHTACVLEMGMNAPGEIARLCEIASPEAGVITNVGPAHLGPLGSLQKVAAAKSELFKGLSPASVAVVNLDDPLLAPWAQELPCRVVSFGLDSRAEVRAKQVRPRGLSQEFVLELPQEEAEISLAAPGRHNVLNALAAAACAYALNQGAAAIKAGLESFASSPGRLDLVDLAGGPTLIDDTYNANPASLAAGLQALGDIAGSRPRALILGDMKELGSQAFQLHREAGALAVASGCSLVLALGEHAAQVAAGAVAQGLNPDSALAFAELEDLLDAARQRLGQDYVVLIKGSRAMAMERVVEALGQGQGEGA